MTPTLERLDHVQIVMPPGGEAAARRFYGEILGLPEVAKPAALAGRGGCWFRRDPVEIHLGVEEGFRPARKAHPGFVASDLDALAARLARRGVDVRWDDALLPTARRFYADDPFGNRLEFLTRTEPSRSAP